MDASDYSVVFLPWGPGFDASKSVRIMATKVRLRDTQCVFLLVAVSHHLCVESRIPSTLSVCVRQAGCCAGMHIFSLLAWPV